MKGLYSVALLVISNVFMTVAWYGHLKFSDAGPIKKWGLFGLILISWFVAFFEYCFQVPANRIGSELHGGPFSLLQLKVIQEVITLVIFLIFSWLVFKTEPLKLTQIAGLAFLVLAVYLIFKK